MKKTLIFAGCMGFLLMGTSAQAAFPTDSTSYPANFKSMPNTVFAPSTGIIAATKKRVDGVVNTESGKVTTLEGNTTTATNTVSANGDKLNAINTNRQPKPATDTCSGAGANSGYSGCGYISGNGTSGTYQWVLIKDGDLTHGMGNN